MGIILRVFRLEVSNTMFTLQTSFKPLLHKGGQKTVVEVTVNSKEENFEDFCPNYVQEFGLRTGCLENISEVAVSCTV